MAMALSLGAGEGDGDGAAGGEAIKVEKGVCPGSFLF
jgi:hypothetical protein